ncbi:MAG: T9SS type A sorting domain-containing protein, partial [Bacteroidota bacterium]
QHFPFTANHFMYLYRVDPKSILMQKIYFGILLLLTFAVYGQKTEDLSFPAASTNATFTLYPNPATGHTVYITTEKNANKDIVVYDVFGEVVLRDRIRDKALNISRLIAGVYVLQVSEGNQTMTRKLVVK